MRVLLVAALLIGFPAAAQDPAGRAERGAIRADAEARSLSEEAGRAVGEAEAVRARRIALAARIQSAEREATRIETRIAALEDRRAREVAALAGRQEEVAELLAVLQTMSRRPAALALLQPESAIETARASALLAAVRPELRLRTAALRQALDRTRTLRREVETERTQLARVQAALDRRIEALLALEAQKRSAADALSADAADARRRAQRLAGEALDLRGLTDAIVEAEEQRPKRRLRSYRPSAAEVDRLGYAAPASGRIMRAFGLPNDVGVLTHGVTVRTRGGAVVTAPAGGTVAYAGPFRGYGGIVIIEHPEAMLTLLSGLQKVGVAAGETVARGAPLGRMAGGDPELYIELRRRGTPVDPQRYLRRGG